MIDKLLKEIEDRADKAADGPWEPHELSWYYGARSLVKGHSHGRKGTIFQINHSSGIGCAENPLEDGTNCLNDWEPQDNAIFIAHARTDIPRLVKALRYAMHEHQFNIEIAFNVNEILSGKQE